MKFKKNKVIQFLSAVFLIASFASTLHANNGIQGIGITEALETALKKNPILKSVRAQRDATEAGIGAAKSDFFPQILVSSGYTHFKEPNIIVPIHKVGVFPPLDNEIYEAITQVKVPLFSGGRTLAGTRAARASATESAVQEDLTEKRLIEGIVQIYIQSQELQDKKGLIIARLQILQQRYRELGLLLNEGRVSPADLGLVTSSIELTRSDSLEIESGFYQLTIRLGQLVGTNSPIKPLVPTQDGLVKKVLLPDSLTAVSQVAGPEVRKAQAQLERTQALRAQASRSFWPEISGFASYFARSGGDLDMTGEWAIGLNISLPIFDGGRRIANVRAAKASVRAAEQGHQAVLQTQNAALRIAFEQWRIFDIRQQHLAQAVGSKSQSVIAQRQRYEAGRISLSELLTQETELLQLQITERGVVYAGQLALTNYHATSGTLTASLAETIVRSVP